MDPGTPRAVARTEGLGWTAYPQPGLLKPPHVTLMNFTGRVMKGWLYVTGPSTKKGAGLRTWIARGETALRAPTRKPGGGTR